MKKTVKELIKNDYSTWMELLSNGIIIHHDDLIFNVTLRYVDRFNLGFVARINLSNRFTQKYKLNYSGVIMVKRIKIDLVNNLHKYSPMLELIFKDESVTRYLNNSLKELLDCLSKDFKEKIQEDVKFLEIDFNYREIIDFK